VSLATTANQFNDLAVCRRRRAMNCFECERAKDRLDALHEFVGDLHSDSVELGTRGCD
jgi:hypothetical protein